MPMLIGDEGMGITGVVITVSDRTSRGERKDKSGPLAVELLRKYGVECDAPIVVKDGIDTVGSAISEALDAGHRLIFTTGGTGVSARDLTPEATQPFIEKELRGVEVQILLAGLEKTPQASLSRGLVGTSGNALIVNAPGSRGGVKDTVGVIGDLIPHIIEQLDGYDGASHKK